MNGKQVSEALAKRAEEVCRFLLSNGQLINGEWAAPNVTGQSKTGKKTTSLRVALQGRNAGLWIDHADSSQKGDLLGLWMATRNCDFRTAWSEAQNYLGVSTPSPRMLRTAKESYLPTLEPAKPAPCSMPGKLDPAGPVFEWLTKHRKLDPETLKTYQIGQDAHGKQVCFPFHDASGELRLVKWRPLLGKKYWVEPKGAPPHLFGLQGIPEDAEELFITEGEIDALTLHGWGFPAVSVPFGAKPGATHDDWIAQDYEWLECFKTIYLAGDMDAVGLKHQTDLARRLGRERCKLIVWPGNCKDANEFAQDGADGSDFFDGPLAEAKDLDPAGLLNARSFDTRIWESFFPSSGQEPGDPTPWTLPFRFRPAEVTTWTGFSKHGKTVMLNYVLVHLASLGRKSCICSLEMKPEKNLQNMMRMTLGKIKPDDEQEFRRALEWMGSYFWIYDKIGTADGAEILEVFEYAAKKYGISHFVIDSLMRCTVHEEDNQGQKEFLNNLCDFAAEQNVHVHLVAHSKKPDAKRPETRFWPSKHDVRGSVHITDLSHNVVCVFRNKMKEITLDRLQDEGGSPGDLRKTAEEHDAMFIVLAQRGGDGDEPMKRLWFGKEDGSWQYRENRLATTRIYLKEES